MYHDAQRNGLSGTISGAAAMSAMDCAKVPHRAPMESALDSVSNSLDEAHTMLAKLTERLSHVLVPEPPSTISGNSVDQAEAVTSPAVSRLHMFRRQADYLTARINGLMARLDT